MQPVERLSIEVTNRCDKACWFCYNRSRPGSESEWAVDEVVEFVADCARCGVKAVSFGGGEPLEYSGLFEVLTALRHVLFRSITTNGLLLSGAVLDRLADVGTEKVHVSIHLPENRREVERVVGQVRELERYGIRSGVNLLVAQSRLTDARAAAATLRAAGIDNERIIYLPMRCGDTPTPEEIAAVAGGEPFQATSCLTRCGPSPRFASIRHDKTAAWCSYTASRRPLLELTHRGLLAALDGLSVRHCGAVSAQDDVPSHDEVARP